MSDETTADRIKPQPRPASAVREWIGQAIGPYKVISLLGEGGFGSVYLAEQTAPVQRRVALKVIKPGMDSRSVVARFEAERQALAMMDHPSVAKVFDAGLTAQGWPFFVMELVRGDPITRYCELERISVEDRVRLMIDICGAVQHAHMKGVLHRDLKPSNILVSSVDGTPLPKVIDFGVAKALHQPLSDTTLYTEMGQLIGTPEYMSPEQARGSADVDTRADIYALGAIMYELLTGVTPVDLKGSRAEGFAGLERTIQDVQPIAPSSRLSQLARAGELAPSRADDAPTVMKRVRGDLDWIVLKCLEKERARRYDSAAALAADLERYLQDEPVLAGPPTATYRAAKFVRRHRVAVLATVIVALSMIAGIVGTTYGLARAMREADAAERARNESEAVTEFLTQMIHSVQPEEAGRDVTVRQVLDDSAQRLSTTFTDRPNVEARLRHAMGLSYWGLGRLDDAEKHLPAVLEIRRATLGPDHIETLRAAANVAALRLEQGRTQDAEHMLRAVVESASRTLGANHALTLGALSNLAVAYARRGADEDALATHRRVLEGQRIALGPEHPHTLGAAINLGDLLSEMGRIDEAEPLLRQAVADWERVHGADKPGTLVAMHSLAMLESKRGRHREAEYMMRRIVESRSRVFGEGHAETASALANLGLILLAQDKVGESEAAYTQALAVMRASLGPGHPKTLTVVSQLATTLELQGWPARARATIEIIIESTKAALQRADVSAMELNNLSWTLLHVEPPELRDVNAALTAASRACNREEADGGKNLWMFLDSLAAAQHEAGMSAEALTNQQKALRLVPPEGEQYRGEMEERARQYEQAANAAGG